jgi:hypothetical protein
MQHIYCQLLKLIQDTYDTGSIMLTLLPDNDELKDYIFNMEYTPDQVFDEDILDEWLLENGWIKRS